MKIKKIIAGVLCIVMLVALLAANAVHVFASTPIVVDFSANDFVMAGIANAEMDYINDGERRVLFVEVTDGFDPEIHEEDSTMGDPNGSIADFDALDLDGDRYQWMRMTLKNESAAPYFEIHFANPNQGYHVSTSVSFPIDPNSDYTTYVWNVPHWSEHYYPKRDADHPQGGTSDPFFNHWTGHITQLRLDFMYYNEPGGQARTGDKIYIEYIAFFETEEAARAWEFRSARTPASIEEARAAAQAERDAAAEEAAQQEAEPDSAPPVGEDGDEDTAEPSEETEPGNENQPANEPEPEDDDDGNLIIFIIIGAVVVVAIIIIVVVTGKKKKAA